jgi:predicted nucleic acid-binding protein
MPDDPLRVMLDTNVVDVLLEDPILRNGLRDLLDRSAAEIYVTHNVVDEILAAAKPDDPDRPARLLHTLFRVGARMQLTSGFVLDHSRFDLAAFREDRRVDAFTEGNPAHIKDALIAGTAEANNLVFVTQEKRRGRTARHLPDLKVISVDELRGLVNARLVAKGRLDPAQLPLVEQMQSGKRHVED